MKAIVLHGSPRRKGNSATLAEQFLGGLKPSGVEHFYLNEMRIRPCQGCERCLGGLPRHCATEDDMQCIYEAFIGADLIVFATPMYWGYMTAQMKAAMDRMEAITEHFAGKTFVVLITYRHHYQSTAAFFQRVCPFFHVDLHVLPCRTTDDRGQDIPITSVPDSLREAHELGVQLRARFGVGSAASGN